jgi:hypothetical protein
VEAEGGKRINGVAKADWGGNTGGLVRNSLTKFRTGMSWRRSNSKGEKKEEARESEEAGARSGDEEQAQAEGESRP